MNTPVTWATDDRCPLCGGQLTEALICTQVIQECQSCGWTVTWAADPDGEERRWTAPTPTATALAPAAWPSS